jgi:hypothetical protein
MEYADVGQVLAKTQDFTSWRENSHVEIERLHCALDQQANATRQDATKINQLHQDVIRLQEK